MRRFTFFAMIAAAAWWAALLPTWLVVEGRELAGVELSQTLPLLPAVSLIVLAISLYGKFSRMLLSLAALTALAGVCLALLTRWESSVAVEAILQESTGLLDAGGEVSSTFSVGLFVLLGLFSSVLAAFAATRPFEKKAPVDAPEPGDSRSLWDEQV